MRRNVITEGADLNSLVGYEFEMQGVRFRGMTECSAVLLDGYCHSRRERNIFCKDAAACGAVILTDGFLRVDR